jgi:YD repeat-containing protein
MPLLAKSFDAATGNSDMTTASVAAASFRSFTDYDEMSRPRAGRGNNGQNVRYTYDANGNIRTVTDSMNRVTTLYYDALNRLIASTDPLNQTTYFWYNAADRLTGVTDPRGHTAAIYVYDGFGQLWAEYSPDTGTTSYQYNAAGQLIQMARNDGSSLGYWYDGLGRLTRWGTASRTAGSAMTGAPMARAGCATPPSMVVRGTTATRPRAKLRSPATGRLTATSGQATATTIWAA